MALSEETRAALDASPVEDVWNYLFEREGCDSGRWWMHAHGSDGKLLTRRFELANVQPTELGPVRIGWKRGGPRS